MERARSGPPLYSLHRLHQKSYSIALRNQRRAHLADLEAAKASSKSETEVPIFGTKFPMHDLCMQDDWVVATGGGDGAAASAPPLSHSIAPDRIDRAGRKQL